MNWEAIGAVAEALGAAGVILTLAYLALQIRQNTTAIQGQSDMEYARETIAWTARQTADPELLSIHAKAINKEPMTKAENQRYIFLMNEWVHLADGCFRQFTRGLMSTEVFENTIADGMISLFDNDVFKAWWDSEAALLSPGFREYINSRRNQASAYKHVGNDFSEILENLSADHQDQERV